MPPYSSASAGISGTALYPGQFNLCWNNESPAQGAASQAVNISNEITGMGANGIAVELTCQSAGAPATPGAGFEVDVQVADTDLDANYVSIAQILLANLNANFVGHASIQPFTANWLRLKAVTFANSGSVNLTGKVTQR